MRMWFSWQSDHSVCMQTWVQSPTPHKQGTHAYNTSTREIQARIVTDIKNSADEDAVLTLIPEPLLSGNVISI